MTAFRPHLLAGAITLALPISAFAESFRVADIRVEGLSRVSAGTVFNYLPIKAGDTFNMDDSAKAVTDLYASNLFSRINLAREGNVLVVQVQEFPVIASIELSGNSSLNSKNIKEAFAKAGFAEGQAYNPAMLQQMTMELYNQYRLQNKYQVQINPTVENLDRGRAAIKFDIQEGRTAQIKNISFVGNKHYSDKRLRKLLDTDTTGWLSFATKDDQINQEKMQADYERLQAFYRDRGFMDFRIDSVQTSLSDDKTRVFLTFNMTEGPAYKITGYTLSGDLVVPEKELRQLVTVKNGLYDKSAVDASITAVQERLADEGYGQAQVNVVPDVNRLTQEVALNFVVTPGQRITVRRIEFTGNKKSYDSVLRRELRQQEMAPYSASDLERSEQRIRRLPQVEQLDKTLRPVPGHPDQVDIVYKVKERSTSYIQGGVGYGQSSGALFSLEYTDDNFFGSGNQFNINLAKGSYQQSYGVSFTDPYFTDNGVSASYSFDYSKYDYNDEYLSDWTSDNMSAMVNFGFPTSEYQKVYFGGGYRRVKIRTGTDVAPEILSYLGSNGRKYNEYVLTSSWVRDTTDDAYFPSKGSRTSLSLDLVAPGSTEKYYSIDAKTRSYWSGDSDNSPVFSLMGNVTYGAGYGSTNGLPFYRRYYAGGINNLRGFRYGSVGPRYSNDDYAGGDFRVLGSAELAFPISFNERSSNLRLGLFTDVGNVWSKPSNFNVKDLRASAGVFMLWNSPVGPLNISYGVPIKKKSADKKESFQFTIGTSF